MSSYNYKKMKISIKNSSEIEKMRVAGKLAAEVLEMITPYVIPGVSTGELDKICFDHIVNNQNAIPANVGYKGYEKFENKQYFKLWLHNKYMYYKNACLAENKTDEFQIQAQTFTEYQHYRGKEILILGKPNDNKNQIPEIPKIQKIL